MREPQVSFKYTKYNPRSMPSLASNDPTATAFNWDQYIYRFDNGYNVSVVRELPWGIDNQQPEDQWQVAEPKTNGEIDHLRHLNDKEVDDVLKRVSNLSDSIDKDDPDDVNVRKVI